MKTELLSINNTIVIKFSNGTRNYKPYILSINETTHAIMNIS